MLSIIILITIMRSSATNCSHFPVLCIVIYSTLNIFRQLHNKIRSKKGAVLQRQLFYTLLVQVANVFCAGIHMTFPVLRSLHSHVHSCSSCNNPSSSAHFPQSALQSHDLALRRLPLPQRAGHSNRSARLSVRNDQQRLG